MSADIYFYRIVTPQIPVQDGVVDLDALDYDTPWLRKDNNVPDWVKEYGIHAELKRDVCDMFAVGEELYGQKPTSISMHSWNPDVETFHFADGTEHDITREEIESFSEEERFLGYVYGRQEIGHIENAYMIDNINDYDEHMITSDIARNLLKDYIDSRQDDLEDEWRGDYYLRPVYILSKVMFEAENSTIVCEVC